MYLTTAVSSFSPLVGVLDEELVDQIALGAHNLDAIVPGLPRHHRTPASSITTVVAESTRNKNTAETAVLPARCFLSGEGAPCANARLHHQTKAPLSLLRRIMKQVGVARWLL